MNFEWLGLCPYRQALDLQARTAHLVGLGQAPATVLACEHPQVITLGKRGRTDSDLRVSPKILSQMGVELVNVDRGGQATLHNPGQLVIYPILPLRRMNLGVREYVCLLSQATRRFFAAFGVTVTDGVDEPGFWCSEKKIGAVGIRVSKGVSTHGIALNITNAMDAFALINQCGMQSTHPTSLALVTDGSWVDEAKKMATSLLGRSTLKVPSNSLLEVLAQAWVAEFEQALFRLDESRENPLKSEFVSL